MRYNNSFVVYCKKLGISIKNKRNQKNIALTEMSNLTGIRVAYLREIELGIAYGVMVDRHLFKIAKALQIKLSDLFDFE